MPCRSPVRGVVFDLDGTLVDSALDFDAMRAEMGLAAGVPVLETLATMAEHDAARCHEILHRHERNGAERATVMLGAAEFIHELHRRGLKQAVWTRNSRAVALATLERVGLVFDDVISRDDAPPKPDPTAILDLCRRWRVEPRETVMLGDYTFDMEAGRRAGARTVLYTAGQPPEACEGHKLADRSLANFADADELLAWMLA
ncbi:MAG: HAD family hydrolase [Planctomycetaceae bacterium]|nr:HAD family hydrolase [Planctomycetaceae bacterium]